MKPGECTASRFDVTPTVIKHEPFCYVPNVTFISLWNYLTLLIEVIKINSARDFIAKYTTSTVAYMSNGGGASKK